MRAYSYLNSAKTILQQYDGSMPLAAWLKQYFKVEKKFGSSDRKMVSHICYCFYRLGRAFIKLPDEDRILVAVFISSTSPNIVLQQLKPEWNEQVSLSPENKLNYLGANEQLEQVFPLPEFLTKEIDRKAFQLSHMIQPDLFLRIRPGREEKLIRNLQAAGIDYRKIGGQSLALSNQTKLENVLVADEDAVVQDLSSQQVLSLLEGYLSEKDPISVWDCCAASGGKSILVRDQYPRSVLAVSDIRPSILHNLEKRFKTAGIQPYQSFVANLSDPAFSIRRKFDLVICDAPCSGSGTWSRTPEQLSFFKEEKIHFYADLQKRIVKNAMKGIKPGGYFLYITCSVFAEENEGMLDFLEQETGLNLKVSRYFTGYNQKADTLFGALFQL
jgi:16S rRNA (cytosine967-C5)-methyltransferase